MCIRDITTSSQSKIYSESLNPYQVLLYISIYALSQKSTKLAKI